MSVIGPSLVSQIPNNTEGLVRAAFPNLATLSPDGPGIVASMSGFLGIPATGVEHAAREGRLYDRFQYTEAFRGKFDYLGQVVLGLLFDHMEFLLSEQDGLPIRVANNLKITWDEISMIEGMLDREPEEASARVMLSTSERREGHLLRRGKAIELERGFVDATEEGAKQYVRQLRQIQKAALETFAYDVLCTMLQVRAQDVHWRMNHWFSDYIDEQALNLYTNNFILWQKESDGASRTVTLADEMQEMRSRTTSSMMILPRGIENLLRGADNSDQLNYDKVGPVAEQRRGMDATKMTSFKGKRVHFTKKYTGWKRGQVPIEPMCDTRIFGEFYVMPPLRPDHPLYNSPAYTYTSSDRNIQIMNLKTDKFDTISLDLAVNNMAIFDKNGYVYNCAPGTPGIGKTMINRSTPESPFEVRGHGGLHYAQCFGAMDREFLSDDSYTLIFRQLIRSPTASTTLQTLALKEYGASAEDVARAFVSTGSAETENQVSSNPPPSTSGLKRGRDLNETITPNTPFVYATLGLSSLEQPQKFTASSSTMGLGDMEKINSEKMTLLDPATAKYYAGLVKTLDEGRRLQVAQRTYGVLNSADDSMITQELLTPLRETLSTSGLKEEQKVQKERLLEKLSQPFTPMVATGSLDTTPKAVAQTKTGLFTLSQVEQAESVQYLDPFTGEKLTRAEPFAMNTIRGLKSALSVMGRDSVSTGTLTPKKDSPMYTVLDNLEKSGNYSDFERRLSIAYSELNGSNNLLSVVINLLMAPLSKKFFSFLVQNNIFLPFVPIIVRPWICVETCAVIIGTGGQRLGAMYIKDPNIMKGSDVVSKMLQWHLTVWSKALIHDPMLISVFDDVCLKSIKGGGTTDFVTPAQIDLMKRHNWEIPMNDRRGSLFCLMGAYIQNRTYPEVINFKTKRMSNPEREMLNSPPAVFIETDSDQLFGQYLRHSPMDDHIMQTWVKQQGNNLCFQGTQLLFHPVKQTYSCVIYSKNNHFGQNMYAGMMHDLRSMSKILEDQHYQDPLKYTQFYSL